MKNELGQIIKKVIEDMGIMDVDPVVELPTNLLYGDYTTNVAMQLAKHLKRKPVEIAEEIVEKLKNQKSNIKSSNVDTITKQSGQSISDKTIKNDVLQVIEKIEVVPPGFINFHISASKLITILKSVLDEKEGFGRRQMVPAGGTLYEGSRVQGQGSRKKVMVEFAHPNTHKAFHIGHLRNITTGECIVRLFESQGVEVIRANYQGDVGMHIAKALYALLQISNIKNQISKIRSEDIRVKVKFLGEAYAEGSKAYEEDPTAKEKIHDYNYLIYAAAQQFQEEKGRPKSSTNYLDFIKGRKDEISEVYELWKETRQWSLDYFETIYKRVGSHFDRYFLESECLRGVDIAKKAVEKGVLELSDGAIIFRGKKYGIDTRVFVNSLGLPTYEAKELALAEMETSEFGNIDTIIHVVGPEQASFFTVTFKAEELLDEKRYKDKQFHLVYGWVKLKHGKMSSRLGNVILGETLLDDAKTEITKLLTSQKYSSQEIEEISERAAIASVKYAFLKVGTLSDIAYDTQESVAITGDTGPYLQYTYARCKSVLRKVSSNEFEVHSSQLDGKIVLNDEEREVLQLIYRFPVIVEKAAAQYAPNVLCDYLNDLASAYNTFYNRHSILGSDKREVKSDKKKNISPDDLSLISYNLSLISQFRLALTEATAQVLNNGLYLLGIPVLERM